MEFALVQAYDDGEHRRKNMTSYEALDSAGKIVAFIANLVVLRVCLSGYGRTKLRPLFLLAVSSGVAVFSLLIDVTLLGNARSEETYAFLWGGTMVLWMVDLALYAWGGVGAGAAFAQGTAARRRRGRERVGLFVGDGVEAWSGGWREGPVFGQANCGARGVAWEGGGFRGR